MLSGIADVREAPAIRRGIAHHLKEEVASCRVTGNSSIKGFGEE